jgi:hypothetical protein
MRYPAQIFLLWAACLSAVPSGTASFFHPQIFSGRREAAASAAIKPAAEAPHLIPNYADPWIPNELATADPWADAPVRTLPCAASAVCNAPLLLGSGGKPRCIPMGTEALDATGAVIRRRIPIPTSASPGRIGRR